MYTTMWITSCILTPLHVKTTIPITAAHKHLEVYSMYHCKNKIKWCYFDPFCMVNQAGCMYG